MPNLLTGQVTMTGSAVRLTTPIQVTAYTIKAPSTNAATVYLGPSTVTTSTGYPLAPGDSLEYECGDQTGQPNLQLKPSDFYAIGTGPDVVAWLASP